MIEASDFKPGMWTIEVFFDGECPLCRREIDMLRRRDQSKKIRFEDISSPEFDPTSLGVSFDSLMAEIHGRTSDGTIIKGVEVFRLLYEAVGFKRLVKLSRLPGISHAMNLGYWLFAKNRLRLTGRCTDSCRLDGTVMANGEAIAAGVNGERNSGQ